MGWSICAVGLLTPPLSSLFKPVLILSQILALVLEPREIGTHPSYDSKAVLGLLVLSSVSKSTLSSEDGMSITTAPNTQRGWRKDMGPFKF